MKKPLKKYILKKKRRWDLATRLEHRGIEGKKKIKHKKKDNTWG